MLAPMAKPSPDGHALLPWPGLALRLLIPVCHPAPELRPEPLATSLTPRPVRPSPP